MATTGQQSERDENPTEFGSDISAARAQAEIAAEEGQRIVYENGFTWKVFIGMLFVCIVMMPGSIYLGLVAGQGLGSAAQWVTIVLFAEVARRSFIPLKRQEIYCLFYMAGSLTATGFGQLPGISGGPFGNFIALQYLMQSPAMATVAPHLPGWIAPQPGASAYIHRNLADPAWAIPITILIASQLFDRMKWMGLGYLLFRLTSDIEGLPFPLAPIAASGSTALAGSREESWRWQVFSVGSIVGLVFGFFYLAIPIFTGIVFAKPLALLPIPFIDMTQSTGQILPTALIGYNPDLTLVLLGFVLPWTIVLGGFISSVLFQIGVNPVLFHLHMYPDFVPSSGTIQTQISLNYDFWISFGIGTQLSLAAIGLAAVLKVFITGQKNVNRARRGSLAQINKERGDFPVGLAFGAWFLATLGYVWLNHKLIPAFPFWIIAFYGLIWTPLNSYVSARLIGLTGQGVSIPFMNQAIVMRSGYTSPDIWFAPLPLNDYGSQAQRFREIELTGTKFTSILYMEIVMLPMILLFSFIYWWFLWHTTEIPSVQFPYAQKFWPVNAASTAIFSQINAVGGAGNWVKAAIKPVVIVSGFGLGLAIYGVMALAKLPLMFYYGFMGGMGSLPHNTVPTFLGALLGRFYFAKRFGAERWNVYGPVLLAGFACGMGLIGMMFIALALIAKTVNYLPF